MRKGVALVGLACVLALAVSACTQAATASVPTGPSIFPDSTVDPLIAAIPERVITPLPTARLEPGLLPPTNRWFSGLVYGSPPTPVYPLPLSFGLTADGYQFGVPTVSASASSIVGPLAPAVTVHTGADSQVVTAYDTASLTIAQRKGGTTLGHTIIAEGSPFVSFTASRSVTLTFEAPFSTSQHGVVTRVVNRTTYGLYSTGSVNSAGSRVRLARGQVAMWFAVAQGASVVSFAAAARHPLVGTALGYSVGNGRASTTIDYRTASGSPTLFVAMRHQYDARSAVKNCGSSGYPSIFGQLRLCSGTSLSWSVAALSPTGALDLTGISTAQRSQLAAQVALDAAATGPFPDDTYFTGKALYRAVNLYSIANQVGATTVAAALKRTLVATLDQWTEPAGCTLRTTHCFVYDGQARGIVGLTPSFGSDVFNDHHFHYGHFLYAAGILAATDPLLARKWAPVLDLLAADLATDGPSTRFPQQRLFDAYAGHSWAGGTGISPDANNQESSSEAVMAWDGLALWARASNQPMLETEATWMLSAEAASADAYWTNFPLGTAAVDGYGHTIVSQVWGGMRTYSTFFSDEPSAKLGIVLLPMSPVAGYLAGDPARIRINILDSAPGGYSVSFVAIRAETHAAHHLRVTLEGTDILAG